MAPDVIVRLLGDGTVTGSALPVERAGQRVLVDCGLFQGPREPRASASLAEALCHRGITAAVPEYLERVTVLQPRPLDV